MLGGIAGAGSADAPVQGHPQAGPMALAPAGKELEAQYAAMLGAARAEIVTVLPKINSQSISAYEQAYADEAAALMAYEATYKGKARIAVDAQAKAEAAKIGKAKAEAYGEAQKRTVTAARPILADLESLLSGGKLDPLLVKCAVLAEATPAGLAGFARQGETEAALVARLLADGSLMKQMLVGGGAKGGNYGRAMQIYTEIQKASPKAGSGILQRVALGTSLEQAAPGENNSRFNIDPVKRYLHYEEAYHAGELDAAFATMTAWECRMITDEPNSEEDLAWCREMLRNYRPDIVSKPDYRWRYAWIVRTDVPYTDPLPPQDDGTSRIQQLLCGGGKCGPRAFVGRLALRSFGIPTWGVRQPGHAALAHWTPQGWTINLGADWKYSTWEGRPGPDFHLESQARAYPEDFIKVLRARWIGDALGEQKANPAKPGTGGFWNRLALTLEQAIVAEAKPVEVALAGEDLAEASEPSKPEAVVSVNMDVEDGRISLSPGGLVSIPAAACSYPTNSTRKIVFMKSFRGGMQLNCSKGGVFEYAIQLPAAGKYELTARVVTVHKGLTLGLQTDKGGGTVNVPLPYTLGKWQETAPVTVTLDKGMNTLRFAGGKDDIGLAIKEFTLKPAG